MKKIIALLLILAALLSLAACGTTPDPGVTPEVPDTPAEPDVPDVPEVPAEPEVPDPPAEPELPPEPPYSYEDATYPGSTLGAEHWDGTLPLVEDDYTITIGVVGSDQVVDYEANHYTLWLEQQTGLDIKFQVFRGTASEIGSSLSMMMVNGEKWPDIILGSGLLTKDMIHNYGSAGYLLNMAGYLQKDSHYLTQALQTYYPAEGDYNEAIRAIYDAVGDDWGKIYSYPSLEHGSVHTPQAQLLINTQWLEKLKLEMPYTVEELYEVLVAFRDKDPNGNKKKDEIPMLGRDANRGQDIIAYLINAWIPYIYNYKVQIEDGRVFSVYDQDEYRQALIFINKLVKEKLLSDQTFVATNGDLATKLKPAEKKPYTVGIIAAAIPDRLEEGHEAASIYQAMPVLADASGRGGFGMLYADPIQYGTVVNAETERPEVAMHLLDFMSSQENYLRQRWGVKGVDWDYLPEDMDGTGLGHLGGDARILLRISGAYDQKNSTCWHLQQTMGSELYWQVYHKSDELSWNDQISKTLGQTYAFYLGATQPEMYYIDDRTPEEDKIYQKYNSGLTSFVKKAREEFCLGTRDPANDEHWQTYLNELYALNFMEAWVNIAQADYDRQHPAADAATDAVPS